MLSGNLSVKNQDKIIDVLEEYIHEKKTIEQVFRTLEKNDWLSILSQLDQTHQYQLRQILINEISAWHLFSFKTAWNNSLRTFFVATGVASIGMLLSAPVTIPTLLAVGAGIDIANTQSVHRGIIDDRASVLLRILDANFSKPNQNNYTSFSSSLYPFSLFTSNANSDSVPQENVATFENNKSLI